MPCPSSLAFINSLDDIFYLTNFPNFCTPYVLNFANVAYAAFNGSLGGSKGDFFSLCGVPSFATIRQCRKDMSVAKVCANSHIELLVCNGGFYAVECCPGCLLPSFYF